ncbi:ZIP family metal transporter [Leeuwenhoekiella sp. MAR_2009_132]|uniref:ZIP family metal transporter n=1 Tax=Leeuwenhoekiella sp. MAR_2009_132 TaxID=1392489 RepID=UPI00048E693D|nr:divalent cation transporter [Leeuwenhoekiella sp. MAR_2009_132]
MENIALIILCAFLSGSTLFIGAGLAYFFEKWFKKGALKVQIIHTSIAFGGGILIAAVALVLIPKGMEALPVIPMAALFLGGAVFFFFLDRYLEKKGGAFSQVMAMLLDYIPEAMALGAVFSADRNMGFLLALYIGIQNLPESFNAFLEMRTGGYSSKKRLILFLILSFLGIAASVSGYYLLSDHPKGTAALMLFSSGGIIYLIFQDIAPMSKINKNWLPALGASLGFLFGMIGLKIMG